METGLKRCRCLSPNFFKINTTPEGVKSRKGLTDQECWVILGYKLENIFHNLYYYESGVFVEIARNGWG